MNLKSLKLLYWSKIKTNIFYNQIEEYAAWKMLFAHSTEHYKEALVDFMFYCGREGISYVTKTDVNDYKSHVLQKMTPFTMKRNMAAIRDLFKYWGARKVVCIDFRYITDEGISTSLGLSDILRNMTKKISSAEQVERNRRLVRDRIENPITWTWAKIAEKYDLKRGTAKDVFDRHAEKYGKPEEIKRYKHILEENYPYIRA